MLIRRYLRAGSRLLAALILAVPVAGCGEATARASGTAAEPVRVERGDLQRELLLTGELAAEEGVVAVAPNVNVWPLQVRWVAEDGREVAAGDRLVEFDTAQLGANLEDLRTAVQEAESRLDQAVARAAAEEATALLARERARADLEKAEMTAAVPADLVSAKELADREKELERARLALAEAEAKVDAQRRGGRATVEAARLQLAEARRDLEWSEESLARLVLRAARDGVLVLAQSPQSPRAVREGDQVWPGMVVARIPDLSSLVVHARLFDVDDGSLTPGARVRAALDAYPGEELDGTVRAVDRIAQPTAAGSSRRAFQVVVDLDEVDRERMRPGMSVKLAVELAPLSGVVHVPRSALRWDGGQPQVVTADGAAVQVALGPCSATRCVLAEGPDEGTLLRQGGAS